MSDEIDLLIDGLATRVRPGTTVAAAILLSGRAAFRRSVNGAPRGPLCGMGICFECCVTIDGSLHQRSCLTPCRTGMNVSTDV